MKYRCVKCDRECEAYGYSNADEILKWCGDCAFMHTMGVTMKEFYGGAEGPIPISIEDLRDLTKERK